MCHQVPISKVRGFKGYLIDRRGYLIGPSGAVIVGSSNTDGYLQVQNRYGGRYLISRLVALHFVVNLCPAKWSTVDHIDGNERNNHYSNLRWLSQRLNNMCKKSSRLCYWNKHKRMWVAKTCGQHVGEFRTFREGFLAARARRAVLFQNLYDSDINETQEEDDDGTIRRPEPSAT